MRLWLPGRAYRQRRHARRSLPPAIRERLRRVLAGLAKRRKAALHVPLALARLVVVDLETTGLRADRDRVIAIGAVAVSARRVRHDDCFERVLRQAQSSRADNILVHRIGAQAQLAGEEPVTALVDFLEYVGDSLLLAFRAEFDAACLGRECAELLGIAPPLPIVDLAAVLPALFPGTRNDTLDDWARFLGLQGASRHQALDDAYLTAAMLLMALERATQLGLHATAELPGIERAHQWLGSTHFRA
jgi:DNA polymerase-3 subunit epsilon